MDTVRLSQLHTSFLRDLLAHGKAAKTVRTYESHFVLLLKFLGRDDLRALDSSTLQEYVGFLSAWRGPHTRGPRLTANSVHGYLASLRSFAQWLVKRKFLKEDPTGDLGDVARPKKLPRAIPPQWAQSLLAGEMSARDRALLMVLRTCALRRNELVCLDLADIDLENGILVVRNGKGGKDRGLPLDSTTRDLLTRWLDARGRVDGPLFIGCRGQRLGTGGVGAVLARVARNAGLPHLTPHQLRHTWATEALDNGVPIHWVSQALGHESLATTQKYAHVRATALKETFERLERVRIVEQAKSSAGASSDATTTQA